MTFSNHLPAVMLSALFAFVGCDGESVMPLAPEVPFEGLSLTPAGERILVGDDGGETLIQLVADHEPSDIEVKDAALFWLFLAMAERDGEFHPALLESGLLSSLDGLADAYPTAFEREAETASSGEALISPDRPFSCEQGCSPEASVYLAPVRTLSMAVLSRLAAGTRFSEGIARLNALVRGVSGATGYTLASIRDTITVPDAAGILGDVASVLWSGAAIAAAATGATSAATVALVAGTAAAIATAFSLGWQVGDIIVLVQRCFEFKAESCGIDAGVGDAGGADGGTDGGPNDAGLQDAGPCPGSPTAIVCGDPPICLEPSSNHRHCGRCDNRCSSGVCTVGICECPTAGQIECAGACIDPMTDAANCGSCAIACGAGRACVEGVCQEPCGDGVCEMGEWSANCATDCGTDTDCEQPGRFKIMGDWVWDEMHEIWWQRGESGDVEMETVTQAIGSGHVAYCDALGARVPNSSELQNLAFGRCTSRPVSLDPEAFPGATNLPYLTDDVCMGWPATRRSTVAFTPNSLDCPRFTAGPFRVRCVRDTAP